MGGKGSRQGSRAPDDPRRELAHLREQHAAVARVLETLSQDPSDLRRVLDTILENAVRLSDADMAWLTRVKSGELLVPNLATYGVPKDSLPVETETERVRLRQGVSMSGRSQGRAGASSTSLPFWLRASMVIERLL